MYSIWLIFSTTFIMTQDENKSWQQRITIIDFYLFYALIVVNYSIKKEPI